MICPGYLTALFIVGGSFGEDREARSLQPGQEEMR